jgi:hypothetical protein
MRKVHELRARGVTILFVSHAVADVKALGDRTMWLEHGRVMELGETDRVAAKYLAAMAEKDSAYLAHRKQPGPEQPRERLLAPQIVERIPNIDHRYGDGRAEVLGIAVLDSVGRAVQLLEPNREIVVRISVRAKAEIAEPDVGFMLRNHLGMDFAGANTTREGRRLEPMIAGDLCTVDFHLELPELYPGSFSFSPAIADGPLEAYRMCDWIDNAIALQMGIGSGEVYGFLHLACRVAVNEVLSAAPISATAAEIE